MRPAPLCLLQLVGDYVSQALDAARDVSDEFEEECLELAGRARRIDTVLQLVKECTDETSFSTAPHNGSSATPAEVALQGLSQMCEALTGLSFATDSTPHISSAPSGLKRVGKHVTLAEAALELMSSNTRVLFRRSNTLPKKRDRDDALVSDGAVDTVFSRLSSLQRRRRFALYTARSALLPRTLPSPVLSEDNSTAVFVSPAVREFATLNMEAECKILEAFFCVDTRAQLLREFASLRSSVEQIETALETAGVKVNRGAMEHNSNDATFESIRPLWFEFPHYKDGVVRIIVRRSLVVDVTWDSVRENMWRVLSFHWILHAQLPPELLFDPLGRPKNSGTARVFPAHHDAAMKFLSNCFSSGFDSGCVGALRLLNAVVMEVIETQCRTLRNSVFIGPLEPCLILDVRPGTHVALTIRRPSENGVANSKETFLKYKLIHGTVVVESREGTDVYGTQQYDLLAQLIQQIYEKKTATSPYKGILIDSESQIWATFTKR